MEADAIDKVDLGNILYMRKYQLCHYFYTENWVHTLYGIQF